MWGFGAVAGQYVGGGLFVRVGLASGEPLRAVLLARYEAPRWFYTTGYLILTDRRLIYTPYRWPFSLMNSHPLCIDLSAVTTVAVMKRHDAGNPASMLLPGMLISTIGGRQHYLWPVASEDEIRALAARIQGLAHDSAGE